jgi:DNA polymerase-3 subunit delta'
MTATASAATLPSLESHPHARAVLAPALSAGGAPSHAYLFHGPAGAGKRTVARAFAAALLADGARAPSTVAERVARGTHPDLTWAAPSGAGEMLVADIEGPVVAAAARTPFESRRRVFVIEDAHAMNDQAANRLLKTLEEPPPFAHLILLAPSARDVLATIASRCQAVRFDPLPEARIEERLREEAARCAGGADDVAGSAPRGEAPAGSAAAPGGEREALRLAACARLALGDARRARELAGERGAALRERAEGFVRAALRGDTGGRAWLELLALAKEDAARAGEAHAERVAGELELLPAKERKRHQREAGEAQRRSERRVRTRALAGGLQLAELWLRDAWCVAEDAEELVYNRDRLAELREDAAGRAPAALRAGVELVRDARLRLGLNVSEELALEALAYRLQALLGAAGADPPGAGADRATVGVDSDGTGADRAAKAAHTDPKHPARGF